VPVACGESGLPVCPFLALNAAEGHEFLECRIYGFRRMAALGGEFVCQWVGVAVLSGVIHQEEQNPRSSRGEVPEQSGTEPGADADEGSGVVGGHRVVSVALIAAPVG